MKDYRVQITAIVCIAFLVGFGVYMGHDAALIGLATSAMGGIAGYTIKKVLKK